MTLARAALLLLGLSLPVLGCQDRLAHLFGAYAYDPTQDCLDAAGVVDVVDGPPPSVPCAILRCWLAPDGTAYITDAACDAPPDYQNQTLTSSGPCVKALAAYDEKGHKLCPTPVDGGTGGSDGTGS